MVHFQVGITHPVVLYQPTLGCHWKRSPSVVTISTASVASKHHQPKTLMVSIDNHKLHVIATDLSDVTMVTVDFLIIAPGER